MIVAAYRASAPNARRQATQYALKRTREDGVRYSVTLAPYFAAWRPDPDAYVVTCH